MAAWTREAGVPDEEHDSWVSDVLGLDMSPPAAAASVAAPAAAPAAESGGFWDGVSHLAGEVVEGVEEAGSAVASGAEAVGSAVVSGAEAVGSAVVEGAEVAGAAVVEGAEVVGAAAVTGAEVVGGAVVAGAAVVGGAVVAGAGLVAEGAKAVGSAVVDGAEAAGSAIVDGAEAAGSAIVDGAEALGSVVAAGADAVGGAVASGFGVIEDWFDAGPKAADVTAAAEAIDRTSIADLKKMTPAEKVKLAKTLMENGSLTPEAKAAQRKLYNGMDLDPDSMKRDGARGDAIAGALKGDKELETARDGWGKTSDAEKVKALRKVVEAQCKQFGIPVPDIVVLNQPAKDGVITNGFFNPDDGKLHLNMNKDSSVNDFEKAVDLALHENAHNYQDKLVKDLQAGRLKPGDPDYTQATMFEVNGEPNGYVEAKTVADLPDYRKQPMEEHSWSTGPATAKKIMKVL